VTIAAQAEDLLKLAQVRAPAERERLLLAIADLCDSADKAGALDAAAVQSLLNDIFMSLVMEAEREIRRRLAEKLASAAWAPRALVNVLALDDIEIARPLIASSPVLQDRDLIRLLVEATIEHQIEVARRPNIGPLIVDAILTQEEPAVLTALACNESAEISADGMQRLVDASRKIPALRPPLVRHEKMTGSLAEQLYAWVGSSLKQAIVARFEVDAEALDAALKEAVKDVHETYPAEAPAKGAKARLTPAASPSKERQETEQRLIAKLHEAGQLRPSYLLRALREGKLSLFEAALAKLGGFKVDQVHIAIVSDRPELLAMACVAVGVDRSVYPTILGLVRGLNGGLPSGELDAANRAFNAFGSHPKSAAATAFAHALAAAV
jgi:uncharacterized protein (DUF2336 family)